MRHERAKLSRHVEVAKAMDWGTTPRIQATKIRLRDILKPRKTIIDYLYDFGDSWEHRLTVTDIHQGEPGISYPRYIGGEWNAPPEDCGGTPGFYETLDAIADREHIGPQCGDRADASPQPDLR